jgi:heme exporter protein D
MQWASLSEFWAMGGYGLYVWGSYVVTAAIIVVEILLLKKSRKQTMTLLKRLRNFEHES